jgi:hypothetical protein
MIFKHKNDAPNNYSIFACVFIATVTLFSESLSNKERGIHKVFTKYAVEMGSGAMICLPSFRKIGSGIQKLIKGDS